MIGAEEAAALAVALGYEPARVYFVAYSARTREPALHTETLLALAYDAQRRSR